MARKTFISYKYSESIELRDDILEALGDDASFYQGETADSPDLTDTTTENIKKNLTDMMFGTSVTIVIISPNIKKSKWIDWEIEYSLKEITRADRTSRTNGIVGVIQKVNGSYDWLIGTNEYDDGCKPRTMKSGLLYEIINKNRFNEKPPVYVCKKCETVDKLTGSYISLIEQDEFLKNHNKYIENAYDKSTNIASYKLCKEIK